MKSRTLRDVLLSNYPDFTYPVLTLFGCIQDTYTQQVEKLLDAELSKSLELERQLIDHRHRLSTAEEHAANAEGEWGM